MELQGRKTLRTVQRDPKGIIMKFCHHTKMLKIPHSARWRRRSTIKNLVLSFHNLVLSFLNLLLSFRNLLLSFWKFSFLDEFSHYFSKLVGRIFSPELRDVGSSIFSGASIITRFSKSLEKGRKRAESME